MDRQDAVFELGGDLLPVDVLADRKGPVEIADAVFAQQVIHPFVAGGAAILQGAPPRLVADVGHLVLDRGLTDAVVAVDRARLVVDDVEGHAAPKDLFRFF